MKPLIFLLLGLSPASLLAQGIVLPEKKRSEVLEGLAAIIQYGHPTPAELRLIPDPFTFGREIEEDKPEPVFEGLSNEAVLEILATTLRSNIIGYQEVGGRSSFATKDYGLLDDEDTILMPMPDSPGKNVTVKILNPDKSGLTLRLEELEVYVPLDGNPAGITNSLQ